MDPLGYTTLVILFGLGCGYLGSEWGYYRGIKSLTPDDRSIKKFLEGKWRA